jgi:solute carrier family 66 (lysosomal lysine-arginine transporter), member 1
VTYIFYLCTGVRISILSGRIDEASDLLNEHFPSVLDQSSAFTPNYEPPSSDRVQYIGPTSIDPAHLSLNLRILAFIEASRTIPLEYTPPSSHTRVLTKPHPTPLYRDPLAADAHQSEQLSRAQKLYAAANMLQKPSDRAIYLTELGHVGGLLAYKVPEESPMSKYLTQARREAVADQINSAILCKCNTYPYHCALLTYSPRCADRTGLPAISYLELYTRYTSTIWSNMNSMGMKAPTPANRPSGLESPVTIRNTGSNTNKFDKADLDVCWLSLSFHLTTDLVLPACASI